MKRFLCMTAVLLVPAVAPAEMVTYHFAGTIDTINFNDSDAFPEGDIGQSFTGWFSYSSDSRDTEIGEIAFSIGSFQSDVLNDRLYPVENPDAMYMYFYGTQGDYDFARTGFAFTDTSGQVFDTSDDQLPTQLSLSTFDSSVFRILGYKTSVGNFYISGPLTTLTLVPEPATISLLALGAVALLRKRA